MPWRRAATENLDDNHVAAATWTSHYGGRWPSLADLKKAILPQLDGAEYFEHVTVLFEGGPADMFVDEIGHRKQLPRNELATAIYRAAWLDEHPTDHPESLPWIAGPAVLFGRRVWS